MITYRFCFLDISSKRVSEQRLQAADDAEAMEIARLLARQLDVEVWQDKRCLGTVPPNGGSTSLESLP